jgi:hypothetical protein
MTGREKGGLITQGNLIWPAATVGFISVGNTELWYGHTSLGEHLAHAMFIA